MDNPDTFPPTAAAAERGAQTYKPALLACYDTLVLGLVCRFVWRAPRRHMRALYERNVSARHLELGPGTGYFLRRSLRPGLSTRLVLADLNPSVLMHCAHRLASHRPETYRRDVLHPFDIEPPLFESVGANFLFHCVPGSFVTKAIVFDHAAAVAAPGCRIFGSTILGRHARHTLAARLMSGWFNRTGLFSNTEDRIEDIETELARRFVDYRLTTRGSVAFFEARYAQDSSTTTWRQTEEGTSGDSRNTGRHAPPQQGSSAHGGL
ncbi:class I SAM-dependent methyltransferase [Nocardia amamiensis]|uniref:Class I SAM-dependent methyltransferase n=1 Tax=Nocardia amamiensis TaxID=404578 RepID=A0ABS0CK66_9NOCA|nr:class I SAM-dependent methyltransferase [Nocardia amamiensis]MBF6296994.1 class I SAM-dependent methyltransferase [Nocardia amamiensis]